MNYNNRRNWNSNNYNNNNYANNRPSKKSGAKFGTDKHGNPYVRGWNASKQNGLVAFIAAPNKNTRVHTSKSGREWENWTIKVSPKMGKPYLVNCLFDVMTKKVIVKEMGIVLNPNAPNGGYCGRFSRK